MSSKRCIPKDNVEIPPRETMDITVFQLTLSLLDKMATNPLRRL